MYFFKTAAISAFILLNLMVSGVVTSPTNSLEPRAQCASTWECKGEAIQKRKCVGERDLTSPGFWVCVDACWISEFRVRARLKVHKSRSGFLTVGGSWSVTGAGVSKELSGGDLILNDGDYGSDVCSEVEFPEYPFGDTKRILGIKFTGVNLNAPIVEKTATMTNGKID